LSKYERIKQHSRFVNETVTLKNGLVLECTKWRPFCVHALSWYSVNWQK